MARRTVIDGTKILIFQQITTNWESCWFIYDCDLWYKDTNFSANHNTQVQIALQKQTVIDGTKILIFQQITTTSTNSPSAAVL